MRFLKVNPWYAVHRAELSRLERSEMIAEWCELVGEEVRQVDAPDKRYHQRGNRLASRELNIPEPEARRSKTIAGLSEEAKEATRLSPGSKVVYDNLFVLSDDHPVELDIRLDLTPYIPA